MAIQSGYFLSCDICGINRSAIAKNRPELEKEIIKWGWTLIDKVLRCYNCSEEKNGDENSSPTIL